jgi:Arc/MetJ-type ribon-helix-helix transcriptional regulator
MPVKKKKQRSALGTRIAARSSVAFARRTITIPHEMESAIDELVGRGKFSSFAQQAFAHELQRESIARWLDERANLRGNAALPEHAVAFAERAWRRRK